MFGGCRLSEARAAACQRRHSEGGAQMETGAVAGIRCGEEGVDRGSEKNQTAQWQRDVCRRVKERERGRGRESSSGRGDTVAERRRPSPRLISQREKGPEGVRAQYGPGALRLSLAKRISCWLSLVRCVSHAPCGAVRSASRRRRARAGASAGGATAVKARRSAALRASPRRRRSCASAIRGRERERERGGIEVLRLK